jgi:hypothetical protein
MLPLNEHQKHQLPAYILISTDFRILNIVAIKMRLKYKSEKSLYTCARMVLHSVGSCNVLMSMYRVGHEKVARLPFCTCPCYCTNFCIYTMLQTRAPFSWPILYNCHLPLFHLQAQTFLYLQHKKPWYPFTIYRHMQNKYCKFILKLLRHVSVLIHILQTVYSCVS